MNCEASRIYYILCLNFVTLLCHLIRDEGEWNNFRAELWLSNEAACQCQVRNNYYLVTGGEKERESETKLPNSRKFVFLLLTFAKFPFVLVSIENGIEFCIVSEQIVRAVFAITLFLLLLLKE